jgi:hypothetical protein
VSLICGSSEERPGSAQLEIRVPTSFRP